MKRPNIQSTGKASVEVTSRNGFTLVEVLIVIVIIIAVAGLSISMSRRAILSANVSLNMENLRSLGASYSMYAAEYGHYPPGQDANYKAGPIDKNGSPLGGRGPDLVNSFQNETRINDSWLSPVLGGKLGNQFRDTQPTNYSGNPGLCYDSSDRDSPTLITTIQHPSATFLLCDGIRIKDDNLLDSHTSIRQWYSDSQETDQSRGSENLSTLPSVGSDRNGPDFRNLGKCHVLFCDGHIESFRPTDFKVKHVSISF